MVVTGLDSSARLSIVVAVLALSACATPYQARGLTGGFKDTRLDANTFRVEFLGNALTPRDRVEAYLMRRAAEVTLANGDDYFVIVDAGTERNVSVVTTPGTYHATTTGSAYAVGSTAYGSATTVGTYSPGISIPVTHYGATTAIVKAFRGEKPAGLVAAFDAREVLQYQGAPAPAAARPTVVRVAAPAPAAELPAPKPATAQPATEPSTVSETLSGTYAGTITGEQAGQRLTMRMSVTIVQRGPDVSGTWATSGGTSGTLHGSIAEPSILTFRVTQRMPCSGEFSGTAVVEVSEPKLVGSYAGHGCRGAVQASFSAVRQ